MAIYMVCNNTWAVSLMRYGASIVKWTKSQLDEIDSKTRKVMAMNKEPLIVTVKISNQVTSENSTQPKEFKKKDTGKRLSYSY